MRKIRGERLGGRGRDLGDVDVVAADPNLHRLWLIECKAVSAARTPWEIGNEFREFVGPAGHLARHARRVEWIRRRVPELLSDLNMVGAGWTVAGLVVTDVPIPTAYRMATTDIPIVPIVESHRLHEVLSEEECMLDRREDGSEGWRPIEERK